MEQDLRHAVIGIDPGKHGGIAVLEGNKLTTYNMPETYPDIFNLLKDIFKEYWSVSVVLEKVGTGRPGQATQAVATFARHNGHLEMALYALGLPTEEVTPNKWMKAYANQTGTKKGLTDTEWKNKLKGLAQRLYPKEKVTLNTADAILLAHYGKSIGL